MTILNSIKTGIAAVFLFCFAIGYSQNSSHTNELPWVKGMFPNTPSDGSYKVVRASNDNLSEARKQAFNSLVMELASKKGVKISTQAINEITSESSFSKNNEDYKESDINKQITRIKRDDFEANFTKVDEYYVYKNGTYYLSVLYLVADTNKQLSKAVSFAYKVDNGAWRSVLVPGWAQFYTGQTGKGIMFLGGTAALIGGGAYFLNKASYNDTRALEAGSVKLKQDYRKKAKSFKTYGYITMGAAAGVYIYNLVDAFSSKKGKMKYDYKNMNLTMSPSFSFTEDSYVTTGVTINFNFK